MTRSAPISQQPMGAKGINSMEAELVFKLSQSVTELGGLILGLREVGSSRLSLWNLDVSRLGQRELVEHRLRWRELGSPRNGGNSFSLGWDGGAWRPQAARHDAAPGGQKAPGILGTEMILTEN